MRRGGWLVDREQAGRRQTIEHEWLASFGQMAASLVHEIKNPLVSIMPQGGVLHVRGGAHGNAVHVEIADTGEGIPPDRLEDIFVPFFTTKAKGFGLGLPICKRIVKDHGGHMAVRSEVGVGTTFRVELPIYRGDARDV